MLLSMLKAKAALTKSSSGQFKGNYRGLTPLIWESITCTAQAIKFEEKSANK